MVVAKPPSRQDKSKGWGKVTDATATVRIANAKGLRDKFIQIMQSPEGADPEPLTMPKCVECSHCGWPVWPRQAHVATKKTFQRAGMTRKGRAAGAAGLDGLEGLDDDEDGDGSDDSRNTVERMADEIEDLKDSVNKLEKENAKLKDELTEAQERVKQLEEIVEMQEEKLEMAAEAETAWREKLSLTRRSVEKLRQAYERGSMVGADRETALKMRISEVADLKQTIYDFKRRRDILLSKLGFKEERLEHIFLVQSVMRFWAHLTTKERLLQTLADTTEKFEKQVGDLKEELSHQGGTVDFLKGRKEMLEKKVLQAAYNLMARSSTLAFPHAQANALRAWYGCHTVFKLENQLSKTSGELKDTQEQLVYEIGKTGTVRDDLFSAERERDRLKEELDSTQLELRVTKEDLAALKAELGEKDKVFEEREQELLTQIQEGEDAYANLDGKTTAEIQSLEGRLEGTERRLAVVEQMLEAARADSGGGTKKKRGGVSASKGGSGNGGLESEEADDLRVVPKGQGVLCVGCLKQLVHRAVQPLPVKKAMTASVPDLEKEKRAFFMKELKGLPSPTDQVHTHAFITRKDPYGIMRLTIFPEDLREALGTDGPPLPASARAAPTSPGSPGLPSLRREKVLRLGDSATTRSLLDFKPRVFR